MADQSPKMPYRQGNPARSAPVQGKATARARWPEARHFAALDLGTNNCRLLIARPQDSGFAVVDAFSHHRVRFSRSARRTLIVVVARRGLHTLKK